MDKLVVEGGIPLYGTVNLSGAKNVAMKALVAALLTDEKVVIRNVPLISSVIGTAEIIKPLGVKVDFSKNNQVAINSSGIRKFLVPLEMGGLYRTATMTIGPLLSRFGKAVVPNPGGCRLGKRPIDRHIEGLQSLGAKVEYKDGFFYASCRKLTGSNFRFTKNTHTGTETLILAAVLAEGRTILENAAAEPEVDDLIALLNSMGAKIRRVKERTIVIDGVKKLYGTDYKIISDRNEAVTFAIASYITHGDIFIKNIKVEMISSFLNKLREAKALFTCETDGLRFFNHGKYKATDVVTGPFPAFMTDWQAPWAVFSTLAYGISTIHETVFESRFGYVKELQKMGAKIEFFNPKVKNPSSFYNFNWNDREPYSYRAIRIYGPTKLHDAVVEVCDLRAGATLVLAALAASGRSVVYGVEHIDRGYERFEKRLSALGANIKRLKE